MSVDTSTALATFKQKHNIISACIYRSKTGNDQKLMEPYLVEIYEAILK